MPNNSYEKGHDFEKKVLQILYKTNPYKITSHDGGSDRGRDIVVNYLIDDALYDVIVQCKYYTRSINVVDISSSLDWAKIHRPALLYIWVYPYLTSSTKDYLDAFSKQYNITVDYEEKPNIETYWKEISKSNSTVIDKLQQRIFLNIRKSFRYAKLKFSAEDCYLVDRVNVRKTLTDSSYHSFYLQGISCCGKTQLLKNVALYYYNQKEKIFWFTFNESNTETQLKSFWIAFSLFFCTEYNDNQLENYFQIYGYHITEVLYNMVFDLIKKYKPIIFVDDVHKCTSDNYELKKLFYGLIENELSFIFFAGWFNIFELSPVIQKKLKSVILDGMSWEDLNQIIIHNTGKGNPSVAKKIVSDYDGLPGFAVIVDENTDLNDFETDKSFLYSIIDYLADDEQTLLFVFVHTTNPLPEHFCTDIGYRDAFYLLLKRKLILKQGNNYIIHDKYRALLLTYPLSLKQGESIINILQNYAKIDSYALLDIVMIYCRLNQYKNAIIFLNENFDILLHKQVASDILNRYQTVEKKLPLDFDKRSIMLNKAILLERCEKYDICQFYIDILGNSIDIQTESWEKIFYLQLRCYYFSNAYDDLLRMVDLNVEKIQQSSKRFLVQTLLLVGRVYYIRGLFENSLYFYLLAYNQVLEINDSILIAKIIHRIAMVEVKLGHIEAAQFSFDYLLKLEDALTVKRKSYIFYRIAECDYKLGNYDKASDNNLMSLHLKESINHKRGLIFCHRLAAKLAFKSGDYIRFDCEIQLALKIAKELQLHKEEMSCMVLQIKLLRKANMNISKDTYNILNSYIKMARDEKNVYRLYQIGEIIKGLYDDLYKESIDSIHTIELELSKDFTKTSELWTNLFTLKVKKLYNEIICDKLPISKKLLIQAGLYDPLI